MLISDNLDCAVAAKELADRFRQHRVSSTVTQKDLSLDDIAHLIFYGIDRLNSGIALS